MRRVHLVRHGRTASNRERRTMGWLDEGIEPAWVPAAAAVADVLAQEPVDWLVSSPLARAVQTAAPKRLVYEEQQGLAGHRDRRRSRQRSAPPRRRGASDRRTSASVAVRGTLWRRAARARSERAFRRWQAPRGE